MGEKFGDWGFQMAFPDLCAGLAAGAFNWLMQAQSLSGAVTNLHHLHSNRPLLAAHHIHWLPIAVWLGPEPVMGCLGPEETVGKLPAKENRRQSQHHETIYDQRLISTTYLGHYYV